MTRRDLWNQTAGRMTLGGSGLTGSNSSDWDMWRRDPTRNPSLRRATADDEALAYADQQNRLQQELLMKEKSRQLQGNVNMLKMANAQPFGVGLFEAPETDFDKKLQGNMQEFVNAGIRGQRLGLQHQRDWERRYLQAMENARRNQAASLDRAKFVRSKFEDDRDFDLAINKEEARRKYLEDMSLDQRVGKQQGRQDNVDELAFEMVRDFGMDPEEAIRVFGIKGPAETVLRSVGGLVESGRGAGDAQAEELADILNDYEMGARKQAADLNVKKRTWWDRTFGDDPVKDEKLPAMDAEELYKLRTKGAEKGVAYDPNKGFFLPPRAPRTPQRAQPLPASVNGIPVVQSREHAIQLNRSLGPGKPVAVPDGQGNFVIQRTR